ncbi:hypothetical protein AJ87_19990 [Rhizobium yanglingense]|nr:hypothetical protein AJ87_19990 [Rhizobium yanglingense]
MSAPDFAHRTDHQRFFLRKRGRPQMFRGLFPMGLDRHMRVWCDLGGTGIVAVALTVIAMR